MNKIEDLIQKLGDKSEDEAYRYSDKLAAIGTSEVIVRMLELIKEGELDQIYLAARTLSHIKVNEKALDPLIEMIHDRRFARVQGVLVEALEGFDLSDHFVDMIRIYLNGNFRASGLAKWHLDFSEFNVNDRTLRKAQKHWKNYLHNTNQDEEFLAKKAEIEAIFADLSVLLSEDSQTL